MHPLLVEFLIRVMSLHYGIERKQDFFRLVLFEIKECFNTREINLLISTAAEDEWGLLDSQPPRETHDTVSPAGLPKPSAIENLKPFVWHDNGHTQLLIPFCHGNNPLMSLQMQWKNEEAPPWVNDPKSLAELTEKLGSYLAWEHVVLQIAASKRHLQTIFDLVPIPVSVITDDYTIERANRSFSELFGLPLEETIGRKCFDLIHALETPIDGCPWKEVQESGSCLNLVLRNGRIDSVSLIPMTTRTGEKKSLHIFNLSPPENQDPADSPGSPEHRFLKLYNALSQPLTVISLVADLMLINPENRFSPEYLQTVRGEIDRIICILKEERKECLALSGSRREL